MTDDIAAIRARLGADDYHSAYEPQAAHDIRALLAALEGATEHAALAERFLAEERHAAARQHTVDMEALERVRAVDAADLATLRAALTGQSQTNAELIAALEREKELTGELTAQQAVLASLVAAAVRWQQAVLCGDDTYGAGKELLAAIEEWQRPATAPGMSPPCLDSAGGASDDQQGGGSNAGQGPDSHRRAES